MAAPVLAAAGTANAGTAGTATPTYPASIAANDILILVAIHYTSVTNPTSWSAPTTGWTSIVDSLINRPVDGIANGRIGVWWKRAAGGESGTVTVTQSGGTTGASTVTFAQIYRLTGCETSGNPWDGAVFKTAASGSGTTATFDTVTISGSERTIVGFYLAGDNIATATPTGYAATLAADTTATGSDAELQTFTKTNTSTDGSVTSATGLATSISWGTVHITFKPPAAAAAASLVTAPNRIPHLIGR